MFALEDLTSRLTLPVDELKKMAKCSGRTWKRWSDTGLSFYEADRLACRLGFLIEEVVPDALTR